MQKIGRKTKLILRGAIYILHLNFSRYASSSPPAPLLVNLQTTTRCNLRCIHCDIREASERHSDIINKEFSTAEINREIWNGHWTKKKGIRSLIFERAVSFYRKFFIATQVRTYVERYFTKEGIFLELGSGSTESSIKISKQSRILGAIDFSLYALLKAKNVSVMDFYIRADIFKLPLKDESIGGIWNVGVMEHFTQDELIEILREFNRVLREGSYCILFWPWVMAPSHLIFSSYQRILQRIGIYKQVFPEAPSMFKKREFVEEILRKAGFYEVKFYPPLLDLTHWVVVGQRSYNRG